MRNTAPGMRSLLGRLVLVILILVGVSVLVWQEGGLRDSRTGEAPGYLNCLYFTVITISTVGYGDIVPVDTVSRMFDAAILTPIRFLVFFIVLGTAYQVALRRLTEEYHMNRSTRNLANHIVICGCGATGRAALRELILQGASADQIVVLDQEESALEEAATAGVVCIVGDATREHVLESIVIRKASHVLVCPGRDDTAVLITLTVRDLNPAAQVVAMCQEEENAKLLERGGAHQIVSPSSAGGTLMAASTRRRHLVDTLTDLLSVGGDLQLDEREIRPEEAGQSPAALDMQVIRVYRGECPLSVQNVSALEAGDVLVYLRNRAGDASGKL